MGNLHDALRAATTRAERHRIKTAAFARLDGRVRTVERGNFRIRILARPASLGDAFRIRVRIERISNSRDVTPDDLNPIVVVNPPYLVEDAAGDVTIKGTDPETGEPVTHTYREDLEANLLGIVRDILRERVG